MHNAWLYYIEAISLVSPLPFMSTKLPTTFTTNHRSYSRPIFQLRLRLLILLLEPPPEPQPTNSHQLFL